MSELVVLVLNVIWMTVQFEQFIKDPTRFNIRERVGAILISQRRLWFCPLLFIS